MTTNLSKSAGKALFPHLSRERRRQLLARIIVILMASILATVSLVVWMLHAIKHFKQSDINFTANF
jgi:hypothetical protein